MRLAIVLLIITLFLPSSAEEKQQLYRGVSDAVQNVAGFCERNASLCDTVGSIADAAGDRAYYGAQLVYEAALGRPWDESRGGDRDARAAPREHRVEDRDAPDRERPYPSYFDSWSREGEGRAQTQPARSTDTLRQQDRAPQWRGPGAS
jgi:hypothetical protein